MDARIIAALITGAFTLLSVWYSHYLKQNEGKPSSKNSPEIDGPLKKTKRKSEIGKEYPINIKEPRLKIYQNLDIEKLFVVFVKVILVIFIGYGIFYFFLKPLFQVFSTENRNLLKETLVLIYFFISIRCTISLFKVVFFEKEASENYNPEETEFFKAREESIEASVILYDIENEKPFGFHAPSQRENDETKRQ